MVCVRGSASRLRTCLCCTLAVENFQDVFGDLLDGVSGLVSLFADSIQNHQTLVTLVTCALLLNNGQSLVSDYVMPNTATILKVFPFFLN